MYNSKASLQNAAPQQLLLPRRAVYPLRVAPVQKHAASLMSRARLLSAFQGFASAKSLVMTVLLLCTEGGGENKTGRPGFQRSSPGDKTTQLREEIK